MIRIGVIGYGYWGPNIVRNFSTTDGATVVAVCDKDAKSLAKVAKQYPAIRCVSESREIITAPDIDAIAIVTPVFTHFELAREALNAGKHIFVEKPFTSTTAEALELIEIAERKHLTIMVDHTFIFTGAVKKMKELIDDKSLGDIYYYDSTRVNLGLFQRDVNVIWDLAPHDFSIMRYLLNERPVAINATGKAHVGEQEDTAYVTVHFDSKLIAHFNINWLSPVKIRTTLVSGQKKSVVWNDVVPDDKIKVYDKGVEAKNLEGIYKLLVSYRMGDMWAPKLEPTEALKLEAEHFIDCINHNKRPINDATAGLDVVRMLEACNESMRHEGKLVRL